MPSNLYERHYRAVKVGRLVRAAEEAGLSAAELANHVWARKLAVSHAEVTEPSDETWAQTVVALYEIESRVTRLPVHETPADEFDPFDMAAVSCNEGNL